MIELEENVRKLIGRLAIPLGFVSTTLEQDYTIEELYELQTYRDLVESMRLIKCIKEDLAKLTEKETSSKKFKQQNLFT